MSAHCSLLHPTKGPKDRECIFRNLKYPGQGLELVGTECANEGRMFRRIRYIRSRHPGELSEAEVLWWGLTCGKGLMGLGPEERVSLVICGNRLSAEGGGMFEAGLKLGAWLERWAAIPGRASRASCAAGRGLVLRASGVGLILACGWRQGGHSSVGRDAEDLGSVSVVAVGRSGGNRAQRGWGGFDGHW